MKRDAAHVKNIARRRALLTALISFAASSFIPLSAAIGEEPGEASRLAILAGEPANFTPWRPLETPSAKWRLVQYEKGWYCRNGHYVCRMDHSGYIGDSCCGCGFCGWWSDH